MISYPSKIKLCAHQNENSRHFVDMGVDVGRTDLTLEVRLKNVLYIFYLELKTKTGKLKDSQIEWNLEFDEHFKAKNATRDVAYGFLEAREKIINWLNNLPPS